MKKRAFCFLCATLLFLFLFSGVSPADGCDHVTRPSEWILVGYVDPQPGVPGYSGDFCCPVCGAVKKKGVYISPLDIDDDDPSPYVPGDTNMNGELPQGMEPPALTSVQEDSQEPSAPKQSAPATKPSGRKRFSTRYPYRRVKMKPEQGIRAEAAGSLIWSYTETAHQ